MKALLIKNILKTDIHITTNVEKELEKLADGNSFLITDIKTKDLLKTKFKDKLILYPKKDINTQKKIFNFFVKNTINRGTKIVVLGGGNLSDIVGFCCGIWMRGIDYIIVPTTLLSQIDASIGGKTAADFAEIKNLIGVFHFPKAVIINPYFTLKQEEKSYLQAIGEIFKYIIIDDKDSPLLINITEGIIKRDINSIEKCIKICTNFKRRIVEKDPFDNKGIRKVLNFGHTLAHALEKTLNILHGDAVFYGCMFELILSVELGLVKNDDIANYIEFFYKFSPKIKIDESIFEVLYSKIRFDKKNIESSNTFLIKTKDDIKIIKNVPKKILKKVWRRLCEKKF